MANVSNPYTFTITANKTVSATISSAVPVEETVLFGWGEDGEGGYDWEDSFIVPNGVTKIKIEAWAGGDGGPSVGYELTNTVTNKTVDRGTIIAVTPNIEYKIYCWCGADGHITGSVSIFYSQSINNMTADYSC